MAAETLRLSKELIRSVFFRPGDVLVNLMEETMTIIKGLVSAIAALIVITAPAYAVSVENKGGDAIKIGIDYGAKEEVKDVAAKKSVTFECPEGCGVTGPWGFSWMAQGDDVIETDGSRLVSG